MHEALDEIYNMLLHNFRPEAILGVATPYFGEEDELLSRTTSFQEGEDDEDINTIVAPTAPAAIHTGPITRARAR